MHVVHAHACEAQCASRRLPWCAWGVRRRRGVERVRRGAHLRADERRPHDQVGPSGRQRRHHRGAHVQVVHVALHRPAEDLAPLQAVVPACVHACMHACACVGVGVCMCMCGDRPRWKDDGSQWRRGRRSSPSSPSDGVCAAGGCGRPCHHKAWMGTLLTACGFTWIGARASPRARRPGRCSAPRPARRAPPPRDPRWRPCQPAGRGACAQQQWDAETERGAREGHLRRERLSGRAAGRAAEQTHLLAHRQHGARAGLGERCEDSCARATGLEDRRTRLPPSLARLRGEKTTLDNGHVRSRRWAWWLVSIWPSQVCPSRLRGGGMAA